MIKELICKICGDRCVPAVVKDCGKIDRYFAEILSAVEACRLKYGLDTTIDEARIIETHNKAIDTILAKLKGAGE